MAVHVTRGKLTIKGLITFVTTHESSHICIGKHIRTCRFHHNDIQGHHETIFDIKYVHYLDSSVAAY